MHKQSTAMPSTAGSACLRSDAGGAQSSVQRFKADSTAWASATPWRPPHDAAVTLSLEGVSSLLRCPKQRPAQFHVLPGCLRPEEARDIHEDASATHDSRQAQMAFVLRQRTAEKEEKQRLQRIRRGRGGRGAPPPSPPERAPPSPNSMRTIDSSLLSDRSRALLWHAVHGCLLPFARIAFPGLPGRWDNLPHFLGVRMHSPQLFDETDRLHVDSTLFTAVCTLSEGFEGGGTFFPTEYENEQLVASQDYNATGVLVRPAVGGCLMYDGALAHSATPVTLWGERALFIFYFHSYLGTGVGDLLDFDNGGAAPHAPSGSGGGGELTDVRSVLLSPTGGGGSGGDAVRAALVAAGFTALDGGAREALDRAAPDEL